MTQGVKYIIPIPRPCAAAPKEQRPGRSPWEWEDAAARRREAIETAIDRIGLDEFAYPDDSPAKQVWNLATLGRRYGGVVG